MADPLPAPASAPRAAGAYALAGLVPGLIALWAKTRWMELRGWRVIARALGVGTPDHLTLLERAGFFRQDVLFGLVVLPALILLMARVVRPRWRAVTVSAVASFVLIAFYVQVRAQDSVGGFLRLGMLVSAVKFGLQRPDYIITYARPGGMLKLLVAIAGIVMGAVWARRRDPAQPPRRGRDLLAPLAAAVVGTAVALVPGGIRTHFHTAMLVDALGSFAGPARVSASSTADPAQLRARYRSLAGAAPATRDPRWFGKARDFDLVIYVLETAPLRCLDSARAFDPMPNVEQLRGHAIAARNHYTTYPYTSLALFSLFSGWYPPQPSQHFMENHAGGHLPGLIAGLRAHGYASTIYAAVESRFEDDAGLYEILGFEHQFYVDPTPTASAGLASTATGDSTALQQMKRDMAQWIAAGRRYVAVFHPEIGHAPWPAPDPVHNPEARQIDRCRALLVKQDLWLGELLGVLDRGGTRNRTLVVMTGDHGIRTRQEDPSFTGGNLDRYSFRVPLIVGAPGLVDTTLLITRVTSHIDVTPTLLDLLGIADGREYEQGVPLWDPALERRTTFFFAGDYLGADGYHREGRFFSYQKALDLAWSAPLLRFGNGDVVLSRSALRDTVVGTLQAMGDLQASWIATLTGRR